METFLGDVPRPPQLGGPVVVSQRGDQFASRERVDDKERYVTLKGPSPSFDRIYNGATWIGDRLVYYAVKDGKDVLVDGDKVIDLEGTATSPLVSPRLWPSPDATGYCAFSSDGTKVRWFLDGEPQVSTFDRLAPVLRITQGRSTRLFAGVNDCTWKVVGHPPSAEVNWDVIHEICATSDGSVVFVYGERASLPMLMRNGEEVLREKMFSFTASRDGSSWHAVVDRSSDGQSLMELLMNGQVVAQASADESRHQFYASADGSSWAWIILSADYSSALLKRPGAADQPFESVPLQFFLSDDGARMAYVRVAVAAPSQVQMVVDGVPQQPHPSIAGTTFRFGPEKAYAYAVIDEMSSVVHSHLGAGPAFEETSQILFLPDGRPVYTGSRTGERYIVVGAEPHLLPADELHALRTLRLEGEQVFVLGRRGDAVIQFRLATD